MTPPELHGTLLGEEPADLHKKLYESGKFGFSDKTLDPERFLAVAMVTLHKTTRVSMHKPARVVLLVPPLKDKWAIEQLDVISERMFRHMKKMPGTSMARGNAAKMVGGWFKVLFVMSRLLQLPEQPDAWTSFGFSKEDPIPDWMREGLLSA